MSKIILTDDSYVDFMQGRYTLKQFSNIDKDGNRVYENISYYSTPYNYIEGSRELISECMGKLLAKVKQPEGKEWTLTIDSHSISRDNPTSAQLTISPNEYPLNLKGALWNIVQKYLTDEEYTPESYLDKLKSTFEYVGDNIK